MVLGLLRSSARSLPRFWAHSKAKSLLLLACAVACAGGRASPPRRISGTSTHPVASSSSRLSGPASPPVVAASDAPAPTLLITEPALLAELEARGLGLAQLFGASNAASNAELSQLPHFAPLVRALELEVQRAKAEDKLAGVDVARYSHRLFDQRFLRSTVASFTLAGVVNRPDRAAFDRATCGETRLIYRLAYSHGAERASKLPMTLGIELPVPKRGGTCREPAARWLEPGSSSSAARAENLRQGPLSEALTRVSPAARVVVNVQLVRYPATVRPDLGGHAEYLLRSFRADASGTLAAEPLENTIDPTAFGSPARQRELAAWLEAQASAVDAGTPLLPASFLTQRTLSVTPRGLSRLANRPFSAALPPRLLAERDFSQGKLIKSPLALLRRLDELSCAGCHEARSVAGFHLLGEDAASAPSENALALPVSPQVLGDLPRRLRVARQMLAGSEPDFSAPFAERSLDEPGGYGAPCSLGRDPTFAAWTCARDLSCSAIEAGAGDLVGQCLPQQPQVGDACESGSVAPHADRRRDRMRSVKVESCAEMICNRSGVGFPAGMCTARCGAPGSACGAIAILDSFNACLARGETFLTCIRGNVSPAGLRACNANQPCRDDYVCARAPSGGVCLPPYFVFQLRVDGHDGSSR